MRRSRLLLRQTRQCLARRQPRELGQEFAARVTRTPRLLCCRKEIVVYAALRISRV